MVPCFLTENHFCPLTLVLHNAQRTPSGFMHCKIACVNAPLANIFLEKLRTKQITHTKRYKTFCDKLEFWSNANISE